MSTKVNFAQAVVSGLKNFARFRSVASRSEYWYFFLFCFLVGVVLNTVDSVLLRVMHLELLLGLADVANILLFVPSLSLVVRRFRDAGYSGRWVLLSLIPLGLIFIGLVNLLSDPTFQQVLNYAISNPNANSVELQNLAYEAGKNLDPYGFLLVLTGIAAGAAYGIFELIIKVQQTKSSAQGNKYAPVEEPSSTEY